MTPFSFETVFFDPDALDPGPVLTLIPDKSIDTCAEAI
jgi:hypothetical protein